ncbi:helix-turn-helix domain-containing protein, partial [Chlorobium ferrooxidans]
RFGNRALDALIHRLRRKYEETNIKIPIKTIHGSGYCFSAPIIIT